MIFMFYSKNILIFINFMGFVWQKTFSTVTMLGVTFKKKLIVLVIRYKDLFNGHLKILG